MSLRELLDTHIASYYLRRTSSALEARVNQGLLEQTVALSALTRAELRFGQAGMVADDRRRKLIDHFLMQLPCLLSVLIEFDGLLVTDRDGPTANEMRPVVQRA